jgi:RNA polymerase sigma-70 factor (ECF subfamily)
MTEHYEGTSRSGLYPPGIIDSSADGYQPEPVGPTTDQHAVFIASFAEFYDVHHAKIAQALAMNFGDAELGREATDEAMTRAYARWGTVSGHDNPAGWVYRVGLNWGRSWFRRAGRRLPWLDRSSVDMPETSDPALRQALRALDDKHRAVVVCRYFLDWSTNQTAAALDLPTGTVKSRLHHALAELRVQLDTGDGYNDALDPSMAPGQLSHHTHQINSPTPHSQEGPSHGS